MATFCTNCGNPLEEGAVFCDMCGSKLDEQPVAQSVQAYEQPPLTAQPELHPVQPYEPPVQVTQPTQQFTHVPQATQQYPQVTQQYAPYQQPAQPPYQQNLPYAQNEGAPQNKKKGLIIGLAIAGVMLALALTLFFVLIVPMMDPHKDDPLPTNKEETIAENDKSTETKDEKDDKDGKDDTEASTETETQTETETETETQTETQPETETEPTTETQPETEPDTQPEAPADTPAEPAKDLPYVDSLGKANASDFAWISDAMGGNLEGEYLAKDDTLGKWKCEFVFDGIWELVYVTIDEDGKITVDPYQINYGEGWDDESGDASYSFNGTFDINRVYGSGENGNIDIYQFVESHGTQYGVGTLTTKNGNSADVYLVRP